MKQRAAVHLSWRNPTVDLPGHWALLKILDTVGQISTCRDTWKRNVFIRAFERSGLSPDQASAFTRKTHGSAMTQRQSLHPAGICAEPNRLCCPVLWVTRGTEPNRDLAQGPELDQGLHLPEQGWKLQGFYQTTGSPERVRPVHVER